MAQRTETKMGRPVAFAIDNNQCVWARAGVTKAMRCINSFDCLGCGFDKKVLDDFQRSELAAGKAQRGRNQARMSLLVSQRKCRHTLSGRLLNKVCNRGYDCVRCPYDQMLEDTDLVHPYDSPQTMNASGFNLGKDHYYHFGHTWARVEYGGRVRVGMDDFALRLLGTQDEIQLPRLGTRVEQNQHQANLFRDENQAETLSPITGVVVAVNHSLTGHEDKANTEPYGQGWFMVVQPTSLRKNLKNLLFGEESMAWMDDEAGRLSAMVADETGHPLAATGGEIISDIYGAVPQLGWGRLVDSFLH